MRPRRDPIRSPRSRSLVGVTAGVLLLGAAACGSADDGEATSDEPIVIEVAGSSAPSDSATPDSATPDSATPDSAASDSVTPEPATGDDVSGRGTSMRVAQLEFHVDGELPLLDGPALSWSYPAEVGLPEDRVRTIAATLGVPGEIRQLPTEEGGGWSIGDGGGAAITVSPSSLLDWWYSPGPTAPQPQAECSSSDVDPAVSAPPDASVSSECTEPQPPVGVPSADEADARAVELLGAIGYDVSQHELEVFADEWSASVTAWRVLGGRRAPVSLSIGFGANGVVTWMSGVLAEPVPSAEYPRIGTTAGLERLQAQYTGGWSAVGDVTMAGRADAGTSADPTGQTDPPVDSGVDPADEPLVDPAPSEPVDVTLTGVEEDLIMVWAVDDVVWLLPAYTFTSADGGRYTVNAVADEYLAQVTPPG